MTRRSYIDKNDEAEELDAEWFTRAKRGRPPFLPGDTKESISIRLDRDIVAYYRATGKGWQSRMNADLRKFVS